MLHVEPQNGALRTSQSRYANDLETLLEAHARFKRPGIENLIDAACHDCFDWLAKNRQSFTADGHRNEKVSWWPAPGPTDDPIMLEERGQTLRWRIFEHGLQQLLRLLVEANVVAEHDEAITKIATSAETNTVWRELVKGHRAGSEHNTISLSIFKDLLKYDPDTRAAKARTKLTQMARIGLIAARGNSSGYAIRIGAVGLPFYEKVYFTTLQRLLPTINPEK